MAGRMISELNDAVTLQTTDYMPLARGSSTLKISGGSFATPTQLDGLSATVDSKFALKTTVTGMSAYADSKFALKTDVTGMSAYADSKFALKTTVSGMSAYVDSKFALKTDPVDTDLTGDGLTSIFAVSGYTTAVSQRYLVFLGGIHQRPGFNYSVSSGNVVFATPPPSGVNINILAL